MSTGCTTRRSCGRSCSSGIATFLCLLVGYPFAYFLARHAGRWRGLFIALFFAPFWISYMLRMLAWISLLEDDGLINSVLQTARDHPAAPTRGSPASPRR